jgi:acid phosphatase (class A)
MERGTRAVARLGAFVNRRHALVAALLIGLGAAATSLWWSRHSNVDYLSGETTEFVAQLTAPPSRDSAITRRELEELLALQRTRTPALVAAARADRKTEVSRFYAVLGIDPAAPPDLPALRRLSDEAESEFGPYVRAAKKKYRRLRPYEIEPGLDPCIGDVKGDLSYPSGHAAYGFFTGRLLSELVPEKRSALMNRAEEYARQRMVCGVHFPSDVQAGREAADYLFAKMHESAAFRRDVAAAKMELRAALALPPSPPPP